MSKVSIIMPVYNAERYLREAVDSVLRQTYPDFELLLINDRSSDGSEAICKEYEEQDSRIVLLQNDTETHGPGPTRNIGLDYATGEYIYFMDADDWIEDRLLECTIERIEETGADIVQFGAIHEGCDGYPAFQSVWRGKQLLTRNEIKNDIVIFWKNKIDSLWIRLFRREPMKTIRFNDAINGEDLCYVMDAMSQAGKIAYIAEMFYHYRYVERSTSRRWLKETIACRMIVWKHQKDFLDSLSSDLPQSIYAVAAYEHYAWAINQLCTKRCPLSFAQKRRELSNLEESIHFDYYRKFYPLNLHSGFYKIKPALVKYGFENALLLLEPVFLRIVRGE